MRSVFVLLSATLILQMGKAVAFGLPRANSRKLTVLAAQAAPEADFDLPLALNLAKASAVAYSKDVSKIKEWAKDEGYDDVKVVEKGQFRFFQCYDENRALLVFRGSDNLANWVSNLNLRTRNHAWGRVHSGFHAAVYRSSDVLNELRAFNTAAKDKTEVIMTGHSLGGALAVLASVRFKIETGGSALVYTFGQPRVGTQPFANKFDVEKPKRLYRVINKRDFVTVMPRGILRFRYSHGGETRRMKDNEITTKNFESQAQTESEQFILNLPAPENGNENVLVQGGSVELVDTDLPSLSQEEIDQLIQLIDEDGYTDRDDGNDEVGVTGTGDWLGAHMIERYIEALVELNTNITL